MKLGNVLALVVAVSIGVLWGAHSSGLTPPAGKKDAKPPIRSVPAKAPTLNQEVVQYSARFPRKNIEFLCRLMPSLRGMRVAHVKEANWVESKPSPAAEWAYFTSKRPLTDVKVALRRDLARATAGEERFPGGTSRFLVKKGSVDLSVTGYGGSLEKTFDYRRDGEQTQVCVLWLRWWAAARWKNGVGRSPSGTVLLPLLQR